MFEIFAEALFWIGSFFFHAYSANETNPEGQRLGIGCGLVLLLLFGTAVVWFWLHSPAG